MRLIEDAKRMLAEEPWSWFEDRAYCVYCNVHRCPNNNTNQCGIRPEPVEEHKTDCPWLAMPRIVAALEAAQQMLDYLDIPFNEYSAKYSADDDWWTDMADRQCIHRLREAMRAAP